jgi:hypothetical protein
VEPHVAEVGRLPDAAPASSEVVRFQRCADAGREDEVVLLPVRPGVRSSAVPCALAALRRRAPVAGSSVRSLRSWAGRIAARRRRAVDAGPAAAAFQQCGAGLQYFFNAAYVGAPPDKDGGTSVQWLIDNQYLVPANRRRCAPPGGGVLACSPATVMRDPDAAADRPGSSAATASKRTPISSAAANEAHGTG